MVRVGAFNKLVFFWCYVKIFDGLHNQCVMQVRFTLVCLNYSEMRVILDWWGEGGLSPPTTPSIRLALFLGLSTIVIVLCVVSWIRLFAGLFLMFYSSYVLLHVFFFVQNVYHTCSICTIVLFFKVYLYLFCL